MRNRIHAAIPKSSNKGWVDIWTNGEYIASAFGNIEVGIALTDEARWFITVRNPEYITSAYVADTIRSYGG